MKEDTISAIDIIYSLPEQLSEIMLKLKALEMANKMLEQKVTTLLSERAMPQQSIQPVIVPIHAPTPAVQKQSLKDDDDGPSEIMDIVTPAAPKKKKVDMAVPFSFSASAPVAPSVPSEIKIPYQEVDINPVSKLPAPQQTSVVVRGRVKEREGVTVNGIEIKIFDSKDVCVKKTKTAATGDWLAMLPPADYTVEFSKPGMKPLLKTITVITGRREMDVLI